MTIQKAKEMTQKLFLHAEGLMGEGPIHENYDPLTGKGLSTLVGQRCTIYCIKHLIK